MESTKIIRGSLKFAVLISSYSFLTKDELNNLFPGWKEALRLPVSPKTAKN